MSSSEVIIQGHGVALDIDTLNGKKALEVINRVMKDKHIYTSEEDALDDILTELSGIDFGSKLLNVEEFEGEVIFYIPPMLPWESSEEYRNLTMDSANEIIANAVGQICEDVFDLKWVEENAEDIYKCGLF